MIVRKALTFQAVVLGACAVVLAWAQPALALDAPKWVAAMYMEAQTQVGLRWQPVPGATGYKVLRSTTPGKGHQEIVAPAQPQHFDTGVTPGTTYYYVLQAVAGAEVSPNSQERSVVVTQTAKSLPPSMGQVVMDQNAAGIRVQWQAVDGAVAYNIYRRESFKPAGKEDLIGSVPNAEPYLDKDNLKKGIEYIYSVSALDATFNETPKSTTLSAKFTPKEEVKVVAKEEDKVVENRKVKFIGGAKFVPEDGVDYPQGQILLTKIVHCDGELFALFTTGEILVFDEKLTSLDRRIKGGGEGDFPVTLSSFVCGYNDDLLGLDLNSLKVMAFSKKNGSVSNTIALDDGWDPKHPLDESQLRPSRVAWKDDEIFINDVNNHSLRVYNRRGKLLRRLGGFGFELGQFSFPADILFLKDGSMVVMEAANSRVQIFGPDEKPLRMFGESGSRVGQFARIAGIDYDPVKKLFYIGDYVSNVIQVFTPEGKVAGVIKSPDPEKNRGFNSVSGIAAGGGLVYSIDYGTAEILAMKDEN